MITIFAPAVPELPGIRIWNPQLIRYAGYRQPNGSIVGDPSHAGLTDVIRQVHADFRGVYGARRVHAELTLGHGIKVGHEAVALLMRRAHLQGAPWHLHHCRGDARFAGATPLPAPEAR